VEFILNKKGSDRSPKKNTFVWCQSLNIYIYLDISLHHHTISNPNLKIRHRYQSQSQSQNQNQKKKMLHYQSAIRPAILLSSRRLGFSWLSSRSASTTSATATEVSPPSPGSVDDGKPQFFGSYKQSGYDPQIGDYPKLKWKSAQLKDPYKKYWDVYDRRNPGEPVHYQDEVISVWGPDVQPYPGRKAALQLLTFFLVIGGVWYAAVKYDASQYNPAIERVYPFDGLREELGGDHAKTHARSAGEEL